MMYHILDWFFVIFHSIITLFNLTGWLWKKTRRLNLYVLLTTGASWFLLGIFFGMGYCFLTDWHWKVLHKLGHYDLPDSYIQYIIHRLTGISFDSALVRKSTLILFLFSLLMSLILNFYNSKLKTKISHLFSK
jgi:hypothetical protein